MFGYPYQRFPTNCPMFHGVWALLERSLRYDARSWWCHASRLVALLAGYGAMLAASLEGPWRGAPGLQFFQNLVQLNAFLIAAAAIGFFPSVITEEKEEGTLGLMLMAGLSPLSILLGKFGSRLMQAAYVVLLQIPFALLGVTLGGVTPHQVLAVYAALLAALFFTANVALLCSMLARNTRAASLWMVVLTVGYCVGSWAVYEIAQALIRSTRSAYLNFGTPEHRLYELGRFLDAVWHFSFFHRIWTILQTGSRFSIIGGHEIAHVSAGLVCFLLAWAAFPWATRQPDQEPIVRGVLDLRIGRRRWFTPGRVWTAAVAWKEFHFLLGGWPVMVVKSAGYLSLWLFLWWYWNVLHYNPQNSWSGDMAVEAAVPFFSLLLALEAAVLASRMFADEIRSQTWPVLMLLPGSLGDLAYRKVAAAVWGLVPVATGLFLLLCTDAGVRGLSDAIDEPMFWAIVGQFVVIVHLSAFYSLYVRWGAVPLAAATVFVFSAMVTMVAQAMFRTVSGADEVFGMLLCLASIAVCVGLHVVTGKRLRELAAK